MLGWYRQHLADMQKQLDQQAKDLQCTLLLLSHYQERENQLRWLENPPPPELISAMRNPPAGMLQTTWVTVPGRRILVLIGAGPPDEVAELDIWNWLNDGLPNLPVTESPSIPAIHRLPLPDRLYGFSQPGGAIVISSRLQGRQTRRAWRLLRDGLRRDAHTPRLVPAQARRS